MEQMTTVSSVTTAADHYSSCRQSPPMCARCQHCAVCNCRSCQVKLCVEYCTTCRCYWRPTFCTVCGKHTGYTQTVYPSAFGCSKLEVCSPPRGPPMLCPSPCNCTSACPPPRPLPDCCTPPCPPPCPPPRPLPDCCTAPGRRIACTQTCFQPACCQPPNPTPPCVPKTYCHICHKFV